MKETELILRREWGEVRIAVVRKRMRSIRLTVRPDGTVRMSAPCSASDERLRRFAEERSEWLRTALSRVQSDRDAGLKILGMPVRLETTPGRGRAVLEGGTLTIRVPDPADGDSVRRAADRALKALSAEFFRERLTALYPEVARLGAPRPELRVRYMTSVWGTCDRKKSAIRLNVNLFCADRECVDYVVLHELVHLLVPGHGKAFYEILARSMPDWRERRRRLNEEYGKYLRKHAV